MDFTFFLTTFDSKSDLELEEIAMDSKSYVLEARFAAITILRNREVHSPIIKMVEEEERKNRIVTKKKIFDDNNQKEYLIRRLRLTPIGATGKYQLKNGNELQTKRLSETLFQIRIQDLAGRSLVMPVLICKVKNDSSYSSYPFFYLRSLIIFGVGGTLLILLISWIDTTDINLFKIFSSIIFIIVLQLIFMPFAFFTIRKTLKNRLRK